MSARTPAARAGGAPEGDRRRRGGEERPARLAELQSWLHQLAIDRQSFVVIIGGGAVLDLAGYAAATVHRGVRVVRLPTTVLSQADSGVG